MRKIIFLLVVGLVFVSAYVMRVQAVQKLTPVIATQFGVVVKKITIDQLDAKSITISNLIVSREDDQSVLNADVKNLQIDVNFSMQDGVQISSVSMDDAKIVLQSILAQEDASDVPVKSYMKFLPLYSVDVNELRFEYHQGDQLTTKFIGSMYYQEELHVVGVTQHNELEVNVDAKIDKDEVNVSLTDVLNDEEFFKLNGSYQIDDDWFLLNAAGDYSLQGFLANIGRQQEVTLGSLSGEYSTLAEFDLAQPIELMLSKSVAKTEFYAAAEMSSEKHSIVNARLDVRAECLLKSFEIENCIFKQPQTIVIEFKDTPAQVREYMGRHFKKYYLELNSKDGIRIERRDVEGNNYVLNGDLMMAAQTDSTDLKAEINLLGLEFKQVDSSWSAQSRYDLTIDARQAKYIADIQRVLLKASGSIDADGEKAKAIISNATRLTLFDVTHNDLFVGRLEVSPKGKVVASYDLASGSIRIAKQKMSVVPRNIKYSDSNIIVDSSVFDLNRYVYSEHGLQMNGDLSVKQMQIQKQGFAIQGADLLASIKLSGDRLTSKGGFLLGSKRAPLSFKLSNNLANGEGKADFKSEPISLIENEVMAQVIGVTGFPLQLKGGSFTLDGILDWKDAYQNTSTFVNLSALQVDGDYAQNPFENLNVDMQLKGDQGWVLNQASELTINKVNVGVPLEDIRMTIDAYEYGVRQQPAIRVSDFYASALEGSIYSKEIDIDLNRTLSQFSIYLSSLSLEKLIELNQTEGLVATGIVNGELPMRLNDGSLEIDGGWMKADENGGFIRYGRVKDVLRGNEDLALVAELLEDFQYNEMSALVNLSPGGGLRLETKLYGRSPEAQIDAPVNLNFNIDLNLWKFLESARLLTRIGRDITEQVTKPTQ